MKITRVHPSRRAEFRLRFTETYGLLPWYSGVLRYSMDHRKVMGCSRNLHYNLMIRMKELMYKNVEECPQYHIEYTQS